MTDTRLGRVLLRAFIATAMAAMAGLAALPQARAAEEVDVALVIAVDISNSMDPEEQALQREGFVEAFRSPLVHEAIRNGMVGRIAVTYFEWAGTYVQHVVVRWTIIDGQASARAFADELARIPPRRGPRTSISGAIDTSVKLLEEGGFEALRRVIDISGDGANNQGRSIVEAREDALDKGIVINGLPIMLKRPTGSFDTENLDVYYRDCVIGGPGAFIVPVRERQQFAEAVRTKIVREVAAAAVPVVPVQATQPLDCGAEERRNQQWWRN
ncbi:DUF1194 domain-containing protein [Alsobacter sp. R-9]